MKVIAELSIIPIGVGLSFSSYIAECERILNNKPLKVQLHSEGTNIEGELDVVLDAIKSCVEAVHQLGAPRVFTNIKISSRVDKPEQMESKVESVLEKI